MPPETGIPEKLFYKVHEVCQYTDTQPYVLRFWESEFPQLAAEKNRNGQRVYRREDVDLILKIKKLLYEEEFTIAGARRRLEEEAAGLPPSEPERVVHAEPARAAPRTADRRLPIDALLPGPDEPEPAKPAVVEAAPPKDDGVERERDAALAELAAVRAELADARREIEILRGKLTAIEAQGVESAAWERRFHEIEAERDEAKERLARTAVKVRLALDRLAP